MTTARRLRVPAWLLVTVIGCDGSDVGSAKSGGGASGAGGADGGAAPDGSSASAGTSSAPCKGPAHFAKSVQVACDPGPIDTNSDSTNCHVVGNACSPVTLASGQARPSAITLDATNVYWVNYGTSTGADCIPIGGSHSGCLTNFVYNDDGAVMKMPIAGGTPTPLASGVRSPSSTIAVDRTSVYWAAELSVVKAPIDGGDPVTLATDTETPHAIVTDATSVYWTVHGTQDTPGAVMKAPIDGGVPMTLASGQWYAEAIALDARYIYWTTSSIFSNPATVMKMPLAGGPAIRLATTEFYHPDIAVDATRVYFVFSTGGGGGNSIKAIPLCGGTATTLVDTNPVDTIALNTTGIYWIESYATTGRVVKMPLTCGNPTRLAGDQNYPSHVAADATNVYWTTAGADSTGLSNPPKGTIIGRAGTVMRLAACVGGNCG